VTISVLVAVVLLARPEILLVPSSRSAWTFTIVGVEIGVALVLSRQQLQHYVVSRHRSAFFAALSLVLLAATALVWLGSAPFSVGWWVVHGIDIAGVFAGCVGVYRSHRLEQSIVELLAPVVALDPLIALQVGLSPVVHQFVAALEAKDPITRHHVVRTAALAVRVGERVALRAHQLRELGLGALLHDIGKLDTPDALLNKPDRLSPEEYQAMQRHTLDGDRIVRTVPALIPIAPLVRAHHERIDGTGYPDRLAGQAIPLAARIIAVCDAFDAMAHTRQYRAGMGRERAVAILREHAGSQWDEAIVEHLVAVDPTPAEGRFLEAIGRQVECDCIEALPEPVRRELARNDL
jgi:HD-GYP domain-containing protein (c-di-GMP phosphodiesterase class II)